MLLLTGIPPVCLLPRAIEELFPCRLQLSKALFDLKVSVASAKSTELGHTNSFSIDQKIIVCRY